LFYEIKEARLPLQAEHIRLHYEYNEPIVVFNYAHRTYEVSHWGNIAVEDKYQIENIGALLEGEFGRVDYDEYGRNGGKNALRKLRARLPVKSFGLWYRDEIGNVSTSRAAREVKNFDQNL
jgi:oligosaccharyltransferase complex subunit alpha (ribophorin I)